MKYYDVNGIQFGLDCQSNDYFFNNIEKYEINKIDVKHFIMSSYVDSIEHPVDTPVITYKNRHIHENNGIESIYVYDDNNEIIQLIKYDEDYSKVELFFLNTLPNLEEREYIFSGILFMDMALYYSMQAIHASAIMCDNKAILFSAPSKTGKSTHARLWKDLYQNIEIINDDKPIMFVEDDTIYVSGSPWSGKTAVNTNIKVPVHSIVFLEQGKTNEVFELSTQDKILYLMRNINRPRQDSLWNKSLSILEKLIDKIPMYKASVTNDVEAARTIRKEIGM